MFDRIHYGDQNIVIDGLLLNGIQSVGGNYLINSEQLKDLTSGYIGEYVSENVVGQFSFSRIMLEKDPIQYLTGDITFNGFLEYKNKVFGFQSGYLDSYRINIAVGNFITITNNITIYGNIGGQLTGTKIPSTGELKAIKPGDIIATVNGSESNRITSINYEMSITRNVLYSMNSRLPILIKRRSPIQVTTTIGLDIDDYESQKLFDVLCTPQIENLTIEFYGDCAGNLVDTIEITNATLYGESYSAAIGQDLTNNLTYRSYIKI